MSIKAEMCKIISIIDSDVNSKESILESIREILNLKYHRKIIDASNSYRVSNRRNGLGFAMSGYDCFDFVGKEGDCDKYNRYILNLFTDGLNLSKDMALMYLDFYKGSGFFYYSYWNYGIDEIKETHFNGESTSEIIYKIIKICLIDNPKSNCRRRN